MATHKRNDLALVTLHPERDPALRRAPAGIPLLIRLDPGASEPLFRQIYRTLRDAILEGRLLPGYRLPSTRTLAGDLDVSRNTVLAAFDQLIAEGYVDSRVGRGTRVAHIIPDRLLRAGRIPARPARVPAEDVAASRRGQTLTRLAERKYVPDEAAVRPFMAGEPAVDRFPWRIWTRLSAKRLQCARPTDANYKSPLGYRPLRVAIARYLAAARGVVCDPDQVLVVGGSQQALDLTARAAIDVGDGVWMEDPGWRGAYGALVAAGAAITSVPVDDEGLDVEAGRARAPHARLAYVSPSHQFPLGVTMSLARRLKLLEWAKSAGAWVVEDDYDSEFRYVSRPLTALHGLAADDRVIYIGTFSKVLFPALRIGYVVAPRELQPALVAGRRFADIHQPLFEQAVLAEFIDGGHFERHIRRMRALYRERQQCLVATLREECGGLLEVGCAEAGMHVLAWLPTGVTGAAVAPEAARRGVDALPLSVFAREPLRRDGLVLGYAHVDCAAMRPACQAIAQAVLDVTARRAGGTA